MTLIRRLLPSASRASARIASPPLSGLAFHLGVALTLGIVIAAHATADNDIILVSARNPSIEIPHGSLLLNDADALGIASTTLTARGTLTDDGSAMTYTFDERFLEAGIDSFRYAPSNATGDLRTVFLVAGLDRFSIAAQATSVVNRSCVLGTDWSFSPGGGAVLDLDENDDCAFRFEPASGPTALLHAPAFPEGPNPGGGHTDISIDTGGLPPWDDFGPTSNLLAHATIGPDPDSTMLFGLRHDADGNVLAVMRRSDGSYVETEPVTVTPGPHQVGLTWWFEGDDAMRDGGVLLEVDGVLVATLDGIENGAYNDTWPRWHFGPYNSTATDTIEVRSPSTWISFTPARFPPQFADNGFAPSAWSRALDPLRVHSVDGTDGEPEWHLALAWRHGGLLVDDTVAGQSTYRSRFEIGLEGLALPVGEAITILGSTQGPVGIRHALKPFRVEMRRDAGGVLQFRASAASDGFETSTEWMTAVSPAERPTIEVKWRAASNNRGDTGAMVLRIGRQSTALHGLHNFGLTLHSVHLGADNVQGARGTLIVDAYDAWH